MILKKGNEKEKNRIRVVTTPYTVRLEEEWLSDGSVMSTSSRLFSLSLSFSLSLFLSLFLSFSLSLFLCVLFPSNMERWTRFECLSNAGPNHSSLLLCSVCFHRLIMQIAEPQLLFLSNRVPFDTGVLRTPFKRWPEYHLFKRHEKPQICY